MANPQPDDAHIRIAHSINEAIMLRDFTKRQRKILDLILRLSWGCGKKEAYIPHQNNFCVVGVYEVDVKTELVWMEQSKIIFRQDALYWFNKDFDQWQISRVHPFLPGKLSDLLSLNLNTDCPKLSDLLRNEGEKLSETLSPENKNLVKHEEKTSQNTKNLKTTPIILKKVLNKDINTYIVTFDFWNKQKITIHRKLLPDTENAIKTALNNFTSEEIQTAITNYAEIINHPDEYWFDYRWTLKDFLKRGLEKFLDGETAKRNYLKDRNNGGSHGINRGNPQTQAGTLTERLEESWGSGAG